MAKGNIELEIGTKYDGDGFNKLNNALKHSGGQVKKASGAVNQLANAMSDMGGKAGKAVGIIGGLAGSFAQMGVAGLVLGGIQLAVQGIVAWFERGKKKAEEFAKTIVEKLKAAFDDFGKQAESV